MRVAIGNKGQSIPCSSSSLRGSLWSGSIFLSPATAFHWAAAQHVIARVPRSPASSFLPGTHSQGEESAQLGPQEAALALQSPLLGSCLSSCQAPPHGACCIQWTSLTRLPFLPTRLLDRCFQLSHQGQMGHSPVCLTSHTPSFSNICVNCQLLKTW